MAQLQCSLSTRQ